MSITTLERNERGEKFCKTGNHWMPLSKFYPHKSTLDKLNNICADCACKKAVLRRYNLTAEQYDAMFAAQGYRCAICKRDTFARGRGWAVDHDHSCCPGLTSCGKCVRGILCGNCNTGIGAMEDNPAYLAAAIEYLRNAN